jgi:hypothetical protein
VAVLALIVLAVAKPWAVPGPLPIAPLLAAASPSPQPTPSPSVTPAPEPTPAPPTGIAAIDWDAVGAALIPHDNWGIRAVVYRADTNTVREEWSPLKSSDTDVQAAVNNADSYAVLGWDGTIVALGVTTPLVDLPLDVRAWREMAASPASRSGWRNLVLTGSTPRGDPSSRLLHLPDEWSDGNGWPSGEYQLDVLLERAVMHIHLWLSGDAGPSPTAPPPRAAPADAELGALTATPGGFIESGTVTVPYVFGGLSPTSAPHDEFNAWLGLGAEHIFWAPFLYPPPAPVVGTANLLGVALPDGQSFVSAKLRQIAPVTADLGQAQFLPGPGTDGVRADAVAVFRPADADAGFPDAVYRVDGTVQTADGLIDLSWDLPVLVRPTSTMSLLLAADRGWPNLPTGAWTVLAPGHRTRLVPVKTTDLPADPGAACGGGANVGPAPWYVGVAHPGAAFDFVQVWRLSGPSHDTPLEIQLSQLVHGFVTIRPLAGDWEAGRYQVVMLSGAKVDAISICVQ